MTNSKEQINGRQTEFQPVSLRRIFEAHMSNLRSVSCETGLVSRTAMKIEFFSKTVRNGFSGLSGHTRGTLLPPNHLDQSQSTENRVL